MTMNFSQAPNQRDMSELIPQGTLSWGVLKITPHDLDNGVWETPSKPPKTSRYLRCDIILEGGKWGKRHVFTNINTHNDNKIAVDIGGGQIKAILECGRGAGPENLDAYDLASYGDLSGMKVAIKVSEEHSEGYNPKNNVAVFLSPFQNAKDWERLLTGDTEPKGVQAVKKPTQGAAAPAQTARWTQPAGAPVQGNGTAGAPATHTATESAAQATPAAGTPPWLGAQPGPDQS